MNFFLSIAIIFYVCEQCLFCRAEVPSFCNQTSFFYECKSFFFSFKCWILPLCMLSSLLLCLACFPILRVFPSLITWILILGPQPSDELIPQSRTFQSPQTKTFTVYLGQATLKNILFLQVLSLQLYLLSSSKISPFQV